MNCNNCKFAIFESYGYSNYTVEGTYFTCAKKLHPDGSFDRFYGEEKKLNYAANCTQFTEGESIYMDVEHENYSDLTEEQLEIWSMK